MVYYLNKLERERPEERGRRLKKNSCPFPETAIFKGRKILSTFH
jgi:hypothetical protein